MQLSVACDVVIQGLCQERKDTSLAFLCTPTDVHVVPKAVSAGTAGTLHTAHCDDTGLTFHG